MKYDGAVLEGGRERKGEREREFCFLPLPVDGELAGEVDRTIPWTTGALGSATCSATCLVYCVGGKEQRLLGLTLGREVYCLGVYVPMRRLDTPHPGDSRTEKLVLGQRPKLGSDSEFKGVPEPLATGFIDWIEHVASGVRWLAPETAPGCVSWDKIPDL